MKQFYSHLIETESIIVELDQLDLSNEQKVHLAHLVDSSLHHVILDAILSELNEEDKKIFLRHILKDDHDKIWKFLNEKTVSIEEKIKKAAGDLKSELHRDLKEVRKTR